MPPTGVEHLRVTIDLESSRLIPEARVLQAELVRCDDGLIVASGRTATTTLSSDTVLRELRDADLETSQGIVQLLNHIGLDMGVPLDLSDLGLVDHIWKGQGGVDSAPLIVEGLTTETNLAAIASSGRGTRFQRATVVPKDNSFDLDC